MRRNRGLGSRGEIIPYAAGDQVTLGQIGGTGGRLLDLRTTPVHVEPIRGHGAGPDTLIHREVPDHAGTHAVPDHTSDLVLRRPGEDSRQAEVRFPGESALEPAADPDLGARLEGRGLP